ncbi:uncharacterized protein LOC125186168 [Salvia hispanica]|uniref:uncharacterized protein LOC125186168 n=1 Tax=Salvia hispanica TaxID=49212 RepID=UPI0020090E3F|nr:uncharacterized protein LOC125186168 [Salvia hispanica]
MSDSDGEESKPAQMESMADLATQFAEFLKFMENKSGSRSGNKSENSTKQESTQVEFLGDIKVETKLNGDNYSLWANLMERAIGGRGLTSHISGVSNPPPSDDPGYSKWQQRDHCCFNWIISNLETSLVNEVSQYKTAKDLWEGLAITYGSGADPFQVHDLHRQAMAMKQGEMSLEALWNKFQDLWLSIDTRDPNPMDSPKSIDKYNKVTQRHRLYQFIWALDEKYDKIRREILNQDPLPSVRKAYGMVRREAVNEKVLKPEPEPAGIAAGLGAFDRSRPFPPPIKFPPSRRQDEDKSKLVCSHCGGKKHTHETCFHLHGYPEWWLEMKKARQNGKCGGGGGGASGGNGRAAAAIVVGGDRATYTEGTVSGVSNSTGGGGNSITPPPQFPNGGGAGGGTGGNGVTNPINIAKASIATTKNWTEGYQNGDDSWAWH